VRFLLIYWSRSLVSNFKIETKNDTSVKCGFVVTALVSQTLKSRSRSMILEKLSESELNLSE